MEERFEIFSREDVGIYWDYKPLCCEEGDFGVYRERRVRVNENSPFFVVFWLACYLWGKVMFRDRMSL